MFGVPLPDRRLHVVLEQHRVAELRDVGRRCEKIAHDGVEALEARENLHQAQQGR